MVRPAALLLCVMAAAPCAQAATSAPYGGEQAREIKSLSPEDIDVTAHAAVRRAHLDAHLAQRAILDAAQNVRDAERRGYRGVAGAGPSTHRHRH